MQKGGLFLYLSVSTASTLFSRLVIFPLSLRLLIMDNFFSAVPKGAFFVKRFGATFGLFVLLTVLGVDVHAQKKTSDSRGARPTEMRPGSNWPHFPTLTEDPATWPGHSLHQIAAWVTPERRLSDWAQDTTMGDSPSEMKSVAVVHPAAKEVELLIAKPDGRPWEVYIVSMKEFPASYVKEVAQKWTQQGRPFQSSVMDESGYTFFEINQYGIDGLQFGVLGGGKKVLKAWNSKGVPALLKEQEKQETGTWLSLSIRYADEMLSVESLVPVPTTTLGDLVDQDTLNREIGATDDKEPGLVQLETGNYRVTWVGSIDSARVSTGGFSESSVRQQRVTQTIWSVRPAMRPFADRWIQQEFPTYLLVDDEATYYAAAASVDGYRRMALVMHDELGSNDEDAAQAGLPEPLLAVFITLPDAEFESMLNELMESSLDE